MGHIDLQMTLQYTRELNLLYVEDDKELQAQTKELLDALFKNVVVKENGKTALEVFEKESFEIVITDIRMPVMDGIELIKRVKAINPMQCIIVTSAYNDTDDLMTFINLGIKQFIHKPIQIDNILEVLYMSAKMIVNERMIESYRKELEKSNIELKNKNDELQSLIRILDAKIWQLSQEKNQKSAHIDTANLMMSDEHLTELKELESDISGASVLISLSKRLSLSNIHVLGNLFIAYSEVLKSYDGFSALQSEIEILGMTLNNAPQNFITRVEKISTLLKSFIYVLRMWRKFLLHQEFKKALDLHASMINDITTIIAIISGTADKIESEMELF
ncbi:MAG: response regulator [Epsilonproteobacteria bacterium]|nr:response regulator [Campylobacterota bacterium]